MDRLSRNLLSRWLIPLVAAALCAGCHRGETPQAAKPPRVRLQPSDYDFVDLDDSSEPGYPRELLARARLDAFGCVRLPMVEEAPVIVSRLPLGGEDASVSLGSPDLAPPQPVDYAPHFAANYNDLSRLPTVVEDVACYPEQFERLRVAQNDARPSAEPELADMATRPSLHRRFWDASNPPSPRSVLVPPEEEVRAENPAATPVPQQPSASSQWNNEGPLPVVIPSDRDSAEHGHNSAERVATRPAQIINPHAEIAPEPETDDAPTFSLPQRDERSDPRAIVPSTLDDSAMRAVSQRAAELNRHAFLMGQRGAHYSARAELIQTLRLISQAHDAKQQTKAHSKALAAGLRAVEEASDFLPRGLALEAHLNMQVLVDGHSTPILKGEDLEQISSVVAAQRYYTFAQQQLSLAGGQEREASVALFGLGRLESMLTSESPLTSGGSPRAMVYHQAAVSVDPGNYKAANELGVLLARFGQYEQARDMLMHSVRVRPMTQSWHNLASVHAKLGETDLARRASHEARLAARPQTDPDSVVRWVPSEALASAPRPAANEMVSPTPSAANANGAAPPASGRSQNLMDYLPWRR